MSVGYTPDRFVWAHDRAAHRSGPVHRDLIALDPARYRLDEKHPVVDRRGVLLPSKPEVISKPVTQTATDSSGSAATPTSPIDLGVRGSNGAESALGAHHP